VTLEHKNGLERLARLLRFRFSRTARRSFVVLAANAPWAARLNTDHLETQRIPAMQSPWLPVDRR
jgi:hypothetical protein